MSDIEHVIGRRLATPSAMSAEVFARRIDALYEAAFNAPPVSRDELGRFTEGGPEGGPNVYFGAIVGRSPSHVSRWRNGHRAIPRWVWVVLNSVATVAEIAGPEAVSYAAMLPDARPPGEWAEPRIAPDMRLRA